MIPTTLKIGSHTFRIQQVSKKELDTDIIGEVETSLNRIRILKDSPPTRKVETLLHEVLHAMTASYEFKDEEFMVVTLGEGLALFMQDNPSFIRHCLKVLSD